MLNFIMTGLMLTVFIGVFIALIITIDLKGKQRIITAIVLAFVIGFGLSALLMVEIKVDNEKWNNGICIECGGKYEFQSSSYRRNADDKYFYKCKNCGYTIELNSLRNS